jgi:hypothetical protein
MIYILFLLNKIYMREEKKFIFIILTDWVRHHGYKVPIAELNEDDISLLKELHHEPRNFETAIHYIETRSVISKEDYKDEKPSYETYLKAVAFYKKLTEDLKKCNLGPNLYKWMKETNGRNVKASYAIHFNPRTGKS